MNTVTDTRTFNGRYKQECISKSTYPPECATPIQLCIGSWSSGIGSSDVMRTLHTSARPVSRQGTIVFDPRVPATPRVPLRCVRYYDAKIRFRSTKTLCRAGSALHTLGGYVLLVQLVMYSWYQGVVKYRYFTTPCLVPGMHQRWP